MSLYLRHRQGRGLIESPKIESNESPTSVKELPKSSKTIDELPTKEKVKKFEELQKSLESLKIHEIKEGQKGRPKKRPLSIKI
jgi:hypothetical protein